MAYPRKDKCYRNWRIDVVEDRGDHWYIATSDGQYYARYSKAAGCPVPEKGMLARVYGRPGDDERGLYLNQRKIAYRSKLGRSEWTKHWIKKNPLRIVASRK